MSHSTTPFTLLPSPSSDRAIESIRRSSPHSQPPEYNIRRNWPGLSNNTIMIWAQRPDATLVAGYRAWQAKGRQVRRGETAIKVYGPVTMREPELDPGGKSVRGPDGKPVMQVRIVGVKPVSVFD
ncbi:MAG TPA: ArdC family protein, partial [Dermatophilaceae bacterium]|nr:ArdC family protein [Dermatophilaceae bacterium]